MKKVRIVYPKDKRGHIFEDFRSESMEMSRRGFLVGTDPSSTDEILIYRGPTIRIPEKYPNDERYINNWEANKRTQFMSTHYQYIAPHSIPTFFMQTLTQEDFINKVKESGWKKVFIRSDVKSLYFDDLNKCIWPNSSLESIVSNYSNYGLKGPFGIRKYIEDDIFFEEQRYWVLNGHIYHPSGVIPEFVKECAIKMYKYSNSRYFTIDVAGKYIVEINPGESSDRGCENPLNFFCDIFAQEFL